MVITWLYCECKVSNSLIFGFVFIRICFCVRTSSDRLKTTNIPRHFSSDHLPQIPHPFKTIKGKIGKHTKKKNTTRLTNRNSVTTRVTTKMSLQFNGKKKGSLPLGFTQRFYNILHLARYTVVINAVRQHLLAETIDFFFHQFLPTQTLRKIPIFAIFFLAAVSKVAGESWNKIQNAAHIKYFFTNGSFFWLFSITTAFYAY